MEVEQGSINLVQGTATYNLPDNTVDLLEHVIRTGAGNVSTQADLTITRISVSTYSSIPIKLTQARPIQVYINRQAPTPTVTVWPTPDGSIPYQFIYWRLRRIQDAGDGSNTMATIDAMQAQGPPLPKVDVKGIFDNNLLRSMESSGLIDKLAPR